MYTCKFLVYLYMYVFWRECDYIFQFSSILCFMLKYQLALELTLDTCAKRSVYGRRKCDCLIEFKYFVQIHLKKYSSIFFLRTQRFITSQTTVCTWLGNQSRRRKCLNQQVFALSNQILYWYFYGFDFLAQYYVFT